MSDRDIGTEILEGLNEIKEFKKGNVELKTRQLSEPSAPQEVRLKLKLRGGGVGIGPTPPAE